jgi:hypothetical protein
LAREAKRLADLAGLLKPLPPGFADAPTAAAVSEQAERLAAAESLLAPLGALDSVVRAAQAEAAQRREAVAAAMQQCAAGLSP